MAMSRSFGGTSLTTSPPIMMSPSATSRRPSISTLCRAGGEAGNVVVHQEGVDDERGCRAEQGAGHDLPPIIDVALDQGGDDADRQHELVGRGGENQRIEKLRP